MTPKNEAAIKAYGKCLEFLQDYRNTCNDPVRGIGVSELIRREIRLIKVNDYLERRKARGPRWEFAGPGVWTGKRDDEVIAAVWARSLDVWAWHVFDFSDGCEGKCTTREDAQKAAETWLGGWQVTEGKSEIVLMKVVARIPLPFKWVFSQESWFILDSTGDWASRVWYDDKRGKWNGFFEDPEIGFCGHDCYATKEEAQASCEGYLKELDKGGTK